MEHFPTLCCVDGDPVWGGRNPYHILSVRSPSYQFLRESVHDIVPVFLLQVQLVCCPFF